MPLVVQLNFRAKAAVNACLMTVVVLLCQIPALATELKSTPKAESPEADSSQASHSPSVLLQGGVSSFGILTDEVQSTLGIHCTKDGSGGTRIKNVRLGSEAANKGLREGDVILDARAENGQFYIKISRDGHIYGAQLAGRMDSSRIQRPVAEAGRPTAFQLDASQFRLNADQSRLNADQFRLNADQFHLNAADSRIRILANYNLELIIDRSLSMRRRDCPGGLSRWDWSAMQATEIARALAPYAPNGVTVTRFAMEFDVHEHSSSAEVVRILQQPDFQFGTRLCEPLAARLDNFFARYHPGDKPLLIAVITDGCPFPRPEPRMVLDELIDASQRMISPGEVTIVFLQLGGDDPRGRNYLLNLGSNLMQYGARYQYVQTKPFEELEIKGLAQALAEAVDPLTRSWR